MVPSKAEMSLFPEILILHCDELGQEDVSLINAIKQSNLFTVQLVLGPVSICKEALLPAQMASLPFSPPKQCFERFGPLDLPLDTEISHDRALVVVENDKEFCRVDSLKSFQELHEVLASYKSG